MKKKNFQKKILVMACVCGVWVVRDEKSFGKNIFVCVKSFLRNPIRPRSYASQRVPNRGPKKARF